MRVGGEKTKQHESLGETSEFSRKTRGEPSLQHKGLCVDCCDACVDCTGPLLEKRRSVSKCSDQRNNMTRARECDF